MCSVDHCKKRKGRTNQRKEYHVKFDLDMFGFSICFGVRSTQQISNHVLDSMQIDRRAQQKAERKYLEITG